MLYVSQLGVLPTKSGFDGDNSVGIYDTSRVDAYLGTFYLHDLAVDRSYTFAIAADPSTSTLYLAHTNCCVDDNEIDIYDTSGALGSTGYPSAGTITGFSSLTAIALDPATSALYAAETSLFYPSHGGDVKVYSSAKGHALIDTIDGFVAPKAVAVDPSAGKLYVLEAFDTPGDSSEDVKVVSTGPGHRVLQTITGISYSGSLAVDTKTHELFVAQAYGSPCCTTPGQVKIFDGGSGALVGTLANGSFDDDVTVDSADDRLYVTVNSAQFGNAVRVYSAAAGYALLNELQNEQITPAGTAIAP